MWDGEETCRSFFGESPLLFTSRLRGVRGDPDGAGRGVGVDRCAGRVPEILCRPCVGRHDRLSCTSMVVGDTFRFAEERMGFDSGS